MSHSVPPSHVITLNDQIYCFEISQHDWSQNLICIAAAKKIILGIIKFPEEAETESFEWYQLKEIYHESRCHAISIAPETSLAVIPKVVTLCAAGADFILRIFRSDLDKSDTVQQLKRHTSYINDVAWDPEGEYLASISDDHSCIVWNCRDNFESVTTFCLTSAGMSVCWHPEESGKLIAAEKNGIIHLYNARSQLVIMSMEAPKVPLMNADWSLYNRYCVAAIAGGDIFTWDLRRISRPTDVKSIHEDNGRFIKICPNSDQITASIGRPDITLKVISSKSQVPLIEAPLKLLGWLGWHNRLPYVAAAYDRKLCFWKVTQIK